MRRLSSLMRSLLLLAVLAPSSPILAQLPPLPTSTQTPGVAVTVVSPSTGSVTSPTAITVTGTGFAAGATVRLGGLSLSATFVDGNTLQATVPMGLPIGPQNVNVVNTSGSTSNMLAGGFTVSGLGHVLYVPIAVKGVGGDDSGIQVQNNAGAAATVFLIYYDQAGNPVSSDGPQTVPGGSSVTFYQPADGGLPIGFDGSAVVHSTQAIAAIVNRVNYAGTLASTGSLTVPAAPAATQFTVPLVYGGLNGYMTTISVQNTSAAAATYALSLQANGSAVGTATAQVTIPPLAVRRIRVGTDIAVPANFIGTATVSSSSATLVAVGESRNSTSSVWLGYGGVAAGATTMNAPLLFKNYNGWISGAQVVNVSNTTVTVNASIRNRDDSTTFGLPAVTLSPNQGTFYDLSTVSSIPENFVGSGVFSASGPIAVTVQETNAGRATGMGYGGFSARTARISIPLIFKRSNGWDTGVQVQNLGAAASTVAITYFLPGGFSVSETDVVMPGDSITFYQPDSVALPVGLVGSATVTSDGQPIVAIVNEVNYLRGGDAAMAYEGINY